MGFKRGQSPKQALNIGLRSNISSWLDGMQVRNYTINDDFTIDVEVSVSLNRKLDGNLPPFIKFRKVDGYFSCDNNNSTSLKGCPKHVVGFFSCEGNKLASLEGCPKHVDGDFDCEYNEVRFTKEDAKKICNIKGHIYNHYL